MQTEPKRLLKRTEGKVEEVKLPVVNTQTDLENEQLVLANAFNFPSKYNEFLLQVVVGDFIAFNHQALAWCLFELKKRNISITEDCECFKLILNDSPYSTVTYEQLVLYTKDIRSAYTTECANYGEHIIKLKTDAAKSNVRKDQLQSLGKLLLDPRSSVEQIKDVLADATEILDKGKLVQTVFKDTIELNKLYAEAIEKRKLGIVVKTHYSQLDNLLTQGFAPGTMSILAGRPGAGKSAFVCNLMLRLATNGVSTALFALEMNCVNMYDRMISIRTKIVTDKLIKTPGDLDELEKRALDNCLEEFASLPILISDKASMAVEDVKRQLTLLDRVNKKPQVVALDLFGKLSDVNVGNELASKIEQKIQEIVEFGRDYGTHFILVTQIRRDDSATKKNYNKRPTLKGLKNSGAYEEAADIVMLLHRNKYYDTSLQDDIMEIAIAKQRMGGTGEVFLEFDPKTSDIVATAKTPVDFGSAISD